MEEPANKDLPDLGNKVAVEYNSFTINLGLTFSELIMNSSGSTEVTWAKKMQSWKWQTKCTKAKTIGQNRIGKLRSSKEKIWADTSFQEENYNCPQLWNDVVRNSLIVESYDLGYKVCHEMGT